MTNDEHLFKHIHITEPIAGLKEAYEAARAEYVLEIAERLLGFAGRMISGSKTGFCKQHPDHFPVFNANVCTDAGKIWFGDIDLTEDEAKLAELARALGQKVYVLYERDGRFGGRDEQPLLENAMLVVTPDSTVEHDKHIRRAEDGRLRPAS
jgi:hypothetical protein